MSNNISEININKHRLVNNSQNSTDQKRKEPPPLFEDQTKIDWNKVERAAKENQQKKRTYTVGPSVIPPPALDPKNEGNMYYWVIVNPNNMKSELINDYNRKNKKS